MANKLNNLRERLNNIINNIQWEEEKPEVTDETVYNIFGDNLEIENTDEELQEMFLFEL